MKPYFAIISFALMLAPTAYADTLYGLYGDVNYWHTSSDSQQQTASDERTAFANKHKGNLTANISVEHGVPLVPNVRVRYADLKASEKANANFDTNAKSIDAIAYYEVLDNVVSVDVGLGAKKMDGSFDVHGKEYLSISKTMPMAYASVGGKLPLTRLSAKAELGLAKGNKASATDANAEIKYDIISKALVDVGVKLGYRTLTYKNDKVSYPAFGNGEYYPFEMTFKGPYLGVEIHF